MRPARSRGLKVAAETTCAVPAAVAFGLRFAVPAASHDATVMEVTIMVMLVMVKVVDIDKAEKASFVHGVPIARTTVVFGTRRICDHVVLVTGIHRGVRRRRGTAAQQRGRKHPC